MAERRQIQVMVAAGLPVAAIARRLARHRATLHREISRNHYHTAFRDRWGKDHRGDYGVTARDMARERWRHLPLASSAAGRSATVLARVAELLNATPRRRLVHAGRRRSSQPTWTTSTDPPPHRRTSP